MPIYGTVCFVPMYTIILAPTHAEESTVTAN